MKYLLDDKKGIINLFWGSEEEEAIEVNISSINDLKKANKENIQFKNQYGFSKYYLNDKNELQERTEESLEIIEAINNKIVEQRRQRYINEVDPYKLEALETDLTATEKKALTNLAKANKIKIKQELPKK